MRTLANIQDAIRDVLEVEAELKADAKVKELRAEGLHVEVEDVELLAHA